MPAFGGFVGYVTAVVNSTIGIGYFSPYGRFLHVSGNNITVQGAFLNSVLTSYMHTTTSRDFHIRGGVNTMPVFYCGLYN